MSRDILKMFCHVHGPVECVMLSRYLMELLIMSCYDPVDHVLL
jgi:hypothetical protein